MSTELLSPEINRDLQKKDRNDDRIIKNMEPASKLVYVVKSAVEPEKQLTTMELVSAKGGWKYDVAVSTYSEKYDRYLPIFQKMIDSIKLT
jgi:hypothetical protein